MQLEARQKDFKNEDLFRTCSVATNPVTSPNNPLPIAVLLCCAVLANYGTVPYSLISFISAELLQIELQAKTELFRIALVKMRSQVVGMRNGLGKRSSSPNCLLMKRSKLASTFERKIVNFYNLILRNLLNFINLFQLWNIF